jgi:hypothetical protein
MDRETNAQRTVIGKRCGKRTPQFPPMSGGETKTQKNTKKMSRQIFEIASEIRRNWQPVHVAARPYLEAMDHLNTVRDSFYYDDARTIILYFLNNAGTWRGDVARRVKAELREAVK